METEERFLQGRKKAMALLTHNDRTKWELCDRLTKAGFEEDVIEDALAYVDGSQIYTVKSAVSRESARIYRNVIYQKNILILLWKRLRGMTLPH